MNAAQPKPSAPTALAPSEIIPPVGKDANQQMQKELEDNSLYNWLRALPTKLKNLQLGNPKVIAAVLLLALAVGLYWWFSGQSKKAEASRWKDLNNSMTTKDLAKISADYPNSIQSLIARRGAAEIMFGTEGTAKLDTAATRVAAIDSIEKAREGFLKLADEFKKLGDKSLWAKCLRQAAEAEESLIGIPKAGVIGLEWDENQDRGTAAKAVEYYTEAAKAIGETTAAGERFMKLGQQLTEKSNRKPGDIPTPRMVGKYLHQQIKVKLPEPDGPKMPDKLPDAPTIVPGNETKAPDKQLPEVILPKTPDKPLPEVILPKTPDKPLAPTVPVPPPAGALPKAPDGVPPAPVNK